MHWNEMLSDHDDNFTFTIIIIDKLSVFDM